MPEPKCRLIQGARAPRTRVLISVLPNSTERAVRTTWPWGHLHSHFSLMKRLDPVVEKGPQNFLGYQSILQQSLNDLPPGLQAMEVYLHRTLSWNEKWDGYP
jgi:hypothetical protein